MEPLALALSALLSASAVTSEVQAPPQGVEAVRAAFVKVGLGTALELARACVQSQPRVCRSLVKSLEQFAALAKNLGELTPVQAQQLLQLDREISPAAPGELTRRVIERFVTAPLELARYHRQAGNLEGSQIIALQVLEVDPANLEARELAGAATPGEGQVTSAPLTESVRRTASGQGTSAVLLGRAWSRS